MIEDLSPRQSEIGLDVRIAWCQTLGTAIVENGPTRIPLLEVGVSQVVE